MADSSASEGVATAQGVTAKGSVERTELSRRQSAMARRVAESKATIPHAHAQRRVEVPDSVASSTAALVAAVGQALAAHPALNSAYRDGASERYSRVNVGFLVETDEGALVPTLFDADKMTVKQIDEQIVAWTAAGAADALTAPELSGGTFTVSAVETGADAVGGVITPGQVAQLGIGRSRRAAVADDGGLRPAEIRDLTLSCDQRAVRPPQAAAFLETLARLFEDR